MIKYRAKPYYKNNGDDYIYGYPFKEFIVGEISVPREVRLSREKSKTVYDKIKKITKIRYWMQIEIEPDDLISKIMIDESTLQMNVPNTDYYEGDEYSDSRISGVIKFKDGAFKIIGEDKEELFF